MLWTLETSGIVFTTFWVILTCYIGYIIITLYDKYYSPLRSLFKKNIVLLVTAHPDDECMFFGPSLVNLVKADCWIHVICLSSGNHYHIGAQRKHELRNSCEILGIPSGNVVIIEHDNLPDDPERRWSKLVLGDIILKYIKTISATVVLSFDQHGISQHINHKSINSALRHLLKKKLLPADCEVYALETTNVIRKYSSFLDVPMTYLTSNIVFISSYMDVGTIQKAMRAHKSQYVWFRKLYMLFSRYVYINTFRRL